MLSFCNSVNVPLKSFTALCNSVAQINEQLFVREIWQESSWVTESKELLLLIKPHWGLQG